jgi:hypothetical protein
MDLGREMNTQEMKDLPAGYTAEEAYQRPPENGTVARYEQ